MPHATAKQASTLLDMSAFLQPHSQALNNARMQVTAAALRPPDEAAIQSKLDAVGVAELALARARADAFANLQSTPDRLDSEQVAWLVAAGGSYPTGFTEPEPMSFEDHRGYVPLFDGVSLRGGTAIRNSGVWRAARSSASPRPRIPAAMPASRTGTW